MILFAIKMMMGDRAKFIGILIGLTFASFIITQQAGIFFGLMQRTYGFVTDTAQPDIWVMDPKVQHIDDIKTMKATRLLRVRGIEGVEWAVPLFKGLLKARLSSGNYQICNIIGIDDSSLIGGPPRILEGTVTDLRHPDAVIVNDIGAKNLLAHPPTTARGKSIPLYLGEIFELNDKRAKVVGFCRVGRTFRSEPVVYTTYDRAISYTPQERNLLTFILVKAAPGVNKQELCNHIRGVTGMSAYTSNQFKRMTVDYFLKNTGILVNFGFAVILGFVIGAVIAGQTFYNFALDNLRYFGTFKAMGATNRLLTRMVVVQALMVGALGWGLGIGLTTLFGIFSTGTELAFTLPWYLLVGSGVAILLMTLLSALISLWKILRLEPAIVFQS